MRLAKSLRYNILMKTFNDELQSLLVGLTNIEYQGCVRSDRDTETNVE